MWFFRAFHQLLVFLFCLALVSVSRRYVSYCCGRLPAMDVPFGIPPPLSTPHVVGSCLLRPGSENIAHRDGGTKYHTTLTPFPTLFVSNNSTIPAPTHSARTQSNLNPQNCFHFLVRAGKTPANSPLSFFAREAGSSPAIPPSQRSRRRYRGSSRYLLAFRRSEMRWERASVRRRR